MFSNSLKKVITVTIVAAMVFSLCACGGKKSEKPEGNAKTGALDGKWTGEGAPFKKTAVETVRVPTEITVFGDDVYALVDDGGLSIVKTGAAGKKLYTAQGAASEIPCLAADEGGIWFAEGGEGGFALKRLSYEGTIISSTALDLAEHDAPRKLVLTDDGTVYVSSNNMLMAFDGKGVGLYKKDLKNERFLGISSDGDGGVLVGTVDTDANKRILSRVDAEGRLAEGRPMPGDNYKIGGGYGEGTLLLWGKEGICSWKMTEEAPKTLVNFGECGIAFNELFTLLPLKNGSFACMDFEGLWLLQPCAPEEITVKTLLSMVTSSQSSKLNYYVEQFNLQSDKYFVELTNYGGGGANIMEDVSNGVTRLNTEIITGKIPDMIDFFGFSPDAYASKGLLCDLYSLIDADKELSREDFMLLPLLETQGKLYNIPQTFTLSSFYGLAEVFGNRHGWSFDEYLEMEASLGANQQMLYNATPENFLYSALVSYIPGALDWEKAECDFDNPKFIALLNAANNIKIVEEYEGDGFWGVEDGANKALRDKRLMMASMHILKLSDIGKFFAPGLCYMGFPTVDGSCGTSVSFDCRVGICESSKNKEGAWEFVKFMLKNNRIEGGGFGIPLLKSSFDAGLEELLRPQDPFAGMEIVKGENGGFYADGHFVDQEYSDAPKPVITREQADEFLSLLGDVRIREDSNSEVFDIINEEASYLFAGQKTAEECAKLVQSRVSLYISERS
ncbi:MAG: hypothetical protein RSC51_07810 [Oscillospiraceae bacterium]